MIDPKLINVVTEYMLDEQGDRGPLRIEKGNCWADFTSVHSNCRCPKMDVEVSMHLDAHDGDFYHMTKIIATKHTKSIELTDLAIAQTSKKDLRTMIEGLTQV